MPSNNQSIIYISINGSKQGQFKSDDTRAGEGRSTAIAFGGKVTVPIETRGKSEKGAGTVQNEPMWIVCEWNAVVAQCLQAAWSNSEPLEDVTLDFKRKDSGGKETSYATMALKKATVTMVEFGVADTARMLPGDHEYSDLARISFSYEEVELEVKGVEGDTKAAYKRKADA
ncbi:type VI secretion system tube protein Hcp [Pendulispora albinea]|uniref:Type VI secretion system tube protein Hcp n=1 Tax=Pendulispora albinea TaxID=2741071 RepID=A0ABZ2M370_9BACT